MAYNQNIPQPTDQISVSQGQILGNFQAINSWVGVNHVGFNVGDSGKHTWVTLQQQTAPSPFLSPEVGISNYNLALTSTSQLWFSYFDNTATKREYPVTASILSTNPTPAYASVGWAYLPSGIFMKWGMISINAVAGAATLPLSYGTASTGPIFTSIINVQITPRSQSALPAFIIGYTLAAPNLGVNPQTIPLNIWQVTSSNLILYTGVVDLSYLIIGA